MAFVWELASGIMSSVLVLSTERSMLHKHAAGSACLAGWDVSSQTLLSASTDWQGCGVWKLCC
jgi:hypothetical protein